MIFTITMTDIVGLILRQNHYHQISQGHPTNDMSDYRALLFVIKQFVMEMKKFDQDDVGGNKPS